MKHAKVKQIRRPELASGAWTLVTTIPPRQRNFLILLNEDTENDMRFALRMPREDAPTLATDGLVLKAGDPGGLYEEMGPTLTYGNAYIYQNSGGALATLAVLEG